MGRPDLLNGSAFGAWRDRQAEYAAYRAYLRRLEVERNIVDAEIVDADQLFTAHEISRQSTLRVRRIWWKGGSHCAGIDSTVRRLRGMGAVVRESDVTWPPIHVITWPESKQ